MENKNVYTEVMPLSKMLLFKLFESKLIIFCNSILQFLQISFLLQKKSLAEPIYFGPGALVSARNTKNEVWSFFEQSSLKIL